MFAIDGDYQTSCSRDPELFFATTKLKVQRAKELCKACRVQLICLENALEFERDSGETMHGIHGGLTPEERKNTTLRRIDGTSIHREEATDEQQEAVAGA